MQTLTFRRALQAEVATLQAQHPILADAIGRAHTLIVDGLVFPLEDGRTAEVGSRTDPAVAYHVNGHCSCKAHEFGNTACKHRLSFRLYQRVCDRLAAEEERDTVDLTADTLPATCEVPAIMSTTLTIAGRQVEVKLCDTDDARLVARIETLLARFPLARPPASAPPEELQPSPEGWCLAHGVQMKLNHGKDGRTWYSHRGADGSWCKGR